MAKASRGKISLFFLLCSLLFPTPECSAQQAQEEPLAPNVRRITRQQLDEAYWGVKYDELDDEFIRKKGDETLFIDAAGEIFIKKTAPGYAGETGKSYSSTEEMLLQEGRWEELAEYNRKASRHLRAPLPRPNSSASSREPRIILSLKSAQADSGQTVLMRVRLADVARDEDCTLGLSLGYDPSLTQFEQATAIEGVRLCEQRARKTHRERAVLRLRLERPATTASAETDGAMAILRFRALQRGQAVFEPLSVEAKAASGKTFVQSGPKVQSPRISPVRVQIR